MQESWTTNAEVQTKVEPHTEELPRWWLDMDDPCLNELIMVASRQNLSLQTAGLRVLEGRARLAAAVGRLFPQQQQLTGSLIYQRISQAEALDSDNTFWSSAAGLGLSWEPDFWGKFRRAIEAEDAALLASVGDFDTALLSLIGDVSRNYILMRLIEERLAIAQANFARQSKSYQLSKTRFDSGTSTERDLQQSATLLFSTKASIPELERDLKQTKNTLAFLLGVPPDQIEPILLAKNGTPSSGARAAGTRKALALAKGIPTIDLLSGAPAIPANVIRARPDIRAAEQAAAAQSARIGVALAELYPSFTLSGAIGLGSNTAGSNTLGDMWSSDGLTSTFGPGFRWNILNYGQLSNLVRIEDARFQQRLTQYQETVIKAQREVEDALIELVKAKESRAARQQATEAARKASDLANIQYEGGSTDYTTVLNSLQLLLLQEDSLARATAAVPLAFVKLQLALGRGWELRKGQDVVTDETKKVMSTRTDWGEVLQSKPAEAEARPPKRLPSW